MKFLVHPHRSALSRARPPVRLFLGFSAVLLLAMAAQRGVDGELTPAGVFEHYLGSGDSTEVMPLTALVESLHTTAFVYGFLWLMLGSLLVVSPVNERLRQVLIFGGAAACAFDLAAPLLVVWSRGAGLVRVASFALAWGLLFTSVVVLLRTFGRADPEPS